MDNSQEPENLPRSVRRQRQLTAYRKRGLTVLAGVLVVLLLGGVAMQAGALRSVGLDPWSADGSGGSGSSETAPPAAREANRAPGSREASGDPGSSRDVPGEQTAGESGSEKANGKEADPEASGIGEKTSKEPEAGSPGTGSSDTKERSGTSGKARVSDEPLNVLVLGADRRPTEAEGAPSRSDTIMLVQVTPGTGRVELLSIPRDLLVEVEPGVEDRINTAYAYGGVKQARAVMEGVTGVTVDHHVIVDFEGFEEIIDAIGGVKVRVEGEDFPEKWHMGDGIERLGGRKALFYARYRGTPGGDLDRIRRQQQLLSALRKKALRWNTVTKLPGIVKTANENVDTDLGVMGAISLGRALVSQGKDADMESYQLKGSPTTLPSGAQVLVPNQKANEAVLEHFRE